MTCPERAAQQPGSHITAPLSWASSERQKQGWGGKAGTDLKQRRGGGQRWREEDLTGIQVFKCAGCQQQGVQCWGREGWQRGTPYTSNMPGAQATLTLTCTPLPQPPLQTLGALGGSPGSCETGFRTLSFPNVSCSVRLQDICTRSSLYLMHPSS